MVDPQRPRVHFMPPAHWMNDPNGLIQWNGVYHLFYQYHPHGAWWANIHWGHATSTDLVHWQHVPIALTPQPGTADADGCWSGCTVDDAGTPTILYTGSAWGHERPCLATGSPDLLVWQADEGNPVIPEPPPGLEVVGFRDPFVWREGDEWRLALGSGLRGVGGTVLLYRSRDLRAWEYLHPLCVGGAADGTMWECPNLFPLGDKHVLCVSVIPTREVLAFVGTYADGRFTPETRQVLDGGQTFYAPQIFRDASGRMLMFGWLAEERPEAVQHTAGWSGALALPRVLTLAPDGMLRQSPAPEIALLHASELPLMAVAPLADVPVTLPGRQCEVALTLAPQPRTHLALAHLGAAGAVLHLTDERATGVLTLRVDGDATPRAVPLLLANDEPLHLRIFVDASVVEVCANDRAWLSVRLYAETEVLPTLTWVGGVTPGRRSSWLMSGRLELPARLSIGWPSVVPNDKGPSFPLTYWGCRRTC